MENTLFNTLNTDLFPPETTVGDLQVNISALKESNWQLEQKLEDVLTSLRDLCEANDEEELAEARTRAEELLEGFYSY